MTEPGDGMPDDPRVAAADEAVARAAEPDLPLDERAERLAAAHAQLAALLESEPSSGPGP
jgi:hypothetical protein